MIRAGISKLFGKITVVFIICCCSLSAQAKYGGGSGTSNDPYLIYDANQMNAIGADQNDWDKHFKLMADIDLSEYTGTEFNIIGDCRWELICFPWPPCVYQWICDSFSGVFDGNGHTISNFTYGCSEDTVGLFRKVSGEIKNLGLVGADVSGGDQVGVLVGYLASGSITECYTDSAVVSGNDNVGGLVGESSGRISDSYAVVSVMGANRVGGLVGNNDAELISNCYAAGVVSGISVGGLVGQGNILHVRNSFWDTERSGESESSGGIGKTTTEMQKASTFFGWSCGGLWTIDEGNDYPRLAWEGRPGEPIPSLGDLLAGSGTEEEPYLIYGCEELNAVGWFECELHKNFRMMADVNLADCGDGSFRIIGDNYYVSAIGWIGTRFTGVFDGNGHTISNFEYVSDSVRDNIGLFGYVLGENAEIKDLGLIDVYVDGGDGKLVGSLVGKVFDGSVSRCYAQGGSVSGKTGIGGLVGSNASGGEISQCYSSVTVNGYNVIGGLVGDSAGIISNSYATGPVSGSHYTGGLVGMVSNLLFNCYSTGIVAEGTHVGGLIGDGGVVGNSFWDAETSGRSTSAGGTNKTTAQMQTADTYLGWNGCGEIIWTIDEGNDYPRLAWQGLVGTPLPTEDLSAFITGSGVENDPYLVYTADELNLIGLFACEWDKHFKLMADIDLSGYSGKEFNVLVWFSGVFDGYGHEISNLTYTTNEGGIGLFGYVVGESAEIKNLRLRGFSIDAGDGKRVGALVGALVSGTVSKCCVEDCSVRAGHGVGGLAGYNNGTISGCSAICEISGTGYDTGGLVGWNYYGEMISNCYAAGTVNGNKRVGGLVGYNTRGTISKCYSVSAVAGNDNIGGLVGYAVDGVTNDCFWDRQTSGQSTSAGGTRKTTAQMQTRSTFTDAGWDFLGETTNGTDDIWRLCEDLVSYPLLAWEFPSGDFLCPDGVNFFDYSFFASQWAEDNCAATNDCDGRDLDLLGSVDIKDLRIFADKWLKGF